VAPRPPVPLGATCLTLVLGAGVLGAVCGGGIVIGIASHAEPRVAKSTARRADAAAAQRRVADAKALLDGLAASIVSAARGAGELPEVLDEALPDDPWGRPVSYERMSAELAVLRSTGPDGKLGTRDDVRRDVDLH